MSWSVEEFREERRRIARNRGVAERIAASKARRAKAEKRERETRGLRSGLCGTTLIPLASTNPSHA
jgi:hypothetical protein